MSKDFIRSLLNVDPIERMDIREAVEHKFITSNYEPPVQLVWSYKNQVQVFITVVMPLYCIYLLSFLLLVITLISSWLEFNSLEIIQ